MSIVQSIASYTVRPHTKTEKAAAVLIPLAVVFGTVAATMFVRKGSFRDMSHLFSARFASEAVKYAKPAGLAAGLYGVAAVGLHYATKPASQP